METHEDKRELSLSRFLNASPETVYRCWTEADLLKQWFAPLPWTTPHAELDVRPGGSNLVVMRNPEGEEFPNRGVYLEIVPNRKIVVTDAYVAAWEPAEQPFMTLILTFDPENGGTRYVARARHWTEADQERHRQMGFHEGWGICAAQLEAVAKGLEGR